MAKSQSPNERVWGKREKKVKRTDVGKRKVEMRENQYGRGVKQEVQKAEGRERTRKNQFWCKQAAKPWQSHSREGL